MKNFIVLLAVAFSANAASTLQLLSNNRIQITAAPSPQRIGVDASGNLSAWVQLTNVQATLSGAIVSDSALATEPKRFYRLANADELVFVSGYVDGGPGFGPVGG